jgi:phosphoribosylformimino-5-aminoimidazole carboxamide ribotide isomerase
VLILPAIDLLGGKCVRLAQGDYNRQTVYSDDPVDVASRFVDEGATWLHIVDLDGARSGSPTNLHILESIRNRNPSVGIELGGGMRSSDAIESALAQGASRVVVGSALTVSNELAETIFRLGDRVVAGIDTRDGYVSVHGWERSTALDGFEFARQMVQLGCRRIIWTDIETDGMLSGPNVSGLKRMVLDSAVPVIASGGVSRLEDLVAFAESGVEGAIVGRAIYEGRFTVAEAIESVR